MSNIFQEVLNDAKGLEKRLVGPTYPYSQNIKTPSSLGMSGKGSMKTLGKDIDGLQEYVKVLVSGDSKASKTGGPLGNKFFLQTGAKCKDKDSNEQVDRFTYINNVPDGSIPFISEGSGTSFKDFRGLIPGAISDLGVLNPYLIMQAFLSGATPPCQEITMETIDNNNTISSETHYVTAIDIKNMPPCDFSDGVNPVTNNKCSENFCTKLPDDYLIKFYIFGFSFLCIYLIYKLMIRV
jgi:hypothetical protein